MIETHLADQEWLLEASRRGRHEGEVVDSLDMRVPEARDGRKETFCARV
jgi:hypothetical protein